ncbi:hypothetical protein MTX26_25015 [Bradyrhizobium sp. ISRA443]|uniref:hypothetical protein n=1 Tax=unclassified Bradyrhizobium TaxID=2631580 RepID=UPI00247A07A4|nr:MULTISPECIES: hypothetical protein [unclassified Bradyrhizobium]WGR93129.1 hypothetical protein MTX20_35945 [Bradyrhizobium sp. ISRA435]WGR97638.1 hypothetical protein MTX23_25010 [Bradyrhizobium sp. ISRA436]WGS04528.1 hypothetical protein MTX18_25015 [Bradyrhizobium sp. ISRA437]WGS11409.1 hypothetical protein MTX26_25015 [Bradyrhizobium sp. ISRA443]
MSISLAVNATLFLPTKGRPVDPRHAAVISAGKATRYFSTAENQTDADRVGTLARRQFSVPLSILETLQYRIIEVSVAAQDATVEEHENAARASA